MKKAIIGLAIGLLAMATVGVVGAQEASECELPDKLDHVTNLQQRGDLLTWLAPTPHCAWRTDADFAVAEKLGDHKSIALFYIVERKVGGEWQVADVIRHPYSEWGLAFWGDPRWTDANPGGTTDYRVGSIWNGSLSPRVQRSR